MELPEGHIWAAGSESTKSGQVFVANIPTEEIFTAPKRDGVNGVIVSSMPFVKDGNIIENFKMTLKDGKIVDVQADKGVEVLRNAIAVDEGASYLGRSPLSRMILPSQTQRSSSTIRCLMRTPHATLHLDRHTHLALRAERTCLRGSLTAAG